MKRAAGPSAVTAPAGSISRPGCSSHRTVQSPASCVATSRATSSPSKARRVLGWPVTVIRGGRRWNRPAASSSSAGAARPANSGRRVIVAMNTPNRPSVSSRRACRDDRHRTAASVPAARRPGSFGIR